MLLGVFIMLVVCDWLFLSRAMEKSCAILRMCESTPLQDVNSLPLLEEVNEEMDTMETPQAILPLQQGSSLVELDDSELLTLVDSLLPDKTS